MEIEMNHFSHEHLLVLKKSEEIEIDATRSYKCPGCDEPISGPFYNCKEGCCYYLHKTCAELPIKMNHVMHPQHPLTLLVEAPYTYNRFMCGMCRKDVGFFKKQFVYNCSICHFDLDMICATGSQTITDKCHMHPLLRVQLPSLFYCHICRKEEKGVSYKCSICPFWVHQNCTLLPETIECDDHDHQLTLFPSVPNEFHKVAGIWWCDICKYNIIAYETVYCCVGCLFFAHASCTTLSKIQSSRDYNNGAENEILLPMKKDWTSLISLIARNSKQANDLADNTIDHFSHNHPLHLHDEGEGNICEACAKPISGISYSCTHCNFNLHKCCTALPEQSSNEYKLKESGTCHFSHDHMLHLHDGELNDKVCGKVCEACAEPISNPSYGCTQCDYFLHKGCIGLPKQISHPFHNLFNQKCTEHVINLFARLPNKLDMFQCSFCYQLCNTFGYECNECVFKIDLKCASISGHIKHEAHKNTLQASVDMRVRCSACVIYRSKIKCEKYGFGLCGFCTMLPPIVNHRYCKCLGFKLRYSPLKDYDSDYYCDLCETTLQPKRWFYHCGDCDQFAHPFCLLFNAGDSNIKFGKFYNLPEHKHVLTLTRFTHEYSNCKICVTSLNKGFAVGFECAICPYFKIHLECVKSSKDVVNRRYYLEQMKYWERTNQMKL